MCNVDDMLMKSLDLTWEKKKCKRFSGGFSGGGGSRETARPVSAWGEGLG